MRERWIMGLAALALVACRSDGERGPAGGDVQPAHEEGQAARQANRAEAHAPAPMNPATQRVFAAVHVLVESELNAARAALEKASCDDVKEYAKRVIAELQPSLGALEDVAKAHGADLAATGRQDPLVDGEQMGARATAEWLGSLSGSAFDSAYAAAQPSRWAVLGPIARQGAQLAGESEDATRVLRRVADDARTIGERARTLVRTGCGGKLGAPHGGA